MPTRRHFIQSAFILPAALTMPVNTQAQDDKTPTIPFADSEGGNFDGWTMEGDAFGVAPATDALFPGKIRGFTGGGFLCSLHKTKGNAATGKAISKEFTIEKPFITFRIGGGNHPNQTCLNLIVEGKIVRTATGDGTASLSESSFDVSNLLGRKAHIEIVDATASPDRGYIMVDEIRFTERPLAYSTVYSSLPRLTVKQLSVIDFFVQYASDPRIRSGNYDGYGVSNAQVMGIGDKVSWRVIQPDLDHVPHRSVEDLARLIEKAVREVIAQLEFKPNKVLEQRLITQGVCDWVRTHVLYNNALGTDANGEYILPRDVIKVFWKSEGILALKKPYCVCSGFARLTLDLATALGLKCHLINGCSRAFGKPIVNLSSTHSWNLFEDVNGYVISVDTVKSAIPLTIARQMSGKIYNPFCLPSMTEHIGLFLCADGAMDYDGRKQIPTHLIQSTLSIEQWGNINTEVLLPVMQSLSQKSAFIYEIP